MPKIPHRKSVSIPGHAHELTFSCYHNYPFLSKDRTCQWLAESINNAKQEFNLSVWAYVFMPTHAHLIIYPNSHDYRISTIFKAIKHPVSRQALKWLSVNSPQWIPKLTQKRGKRIERHFWQIGGGYDRNIDSHEFFEPMLDYIHANPVRKQLADKPVDWKWSSARWYELGEVGPIEIDPMV